MSGRKIPREENVLCFYKEKLENASKAISRTPCQLPRTALDRLQALLLLLRCLGKAGRGSLSSQRGKEELFLMSRDHSPHLFIDKDQVSLDMIELIPIWSIQNIQPVWGSVTLE